jgi:pilus assembly protein CpaE
MATKSILAYLRSADDRAAVEAMASARGMTAETRDGSLAEAAESAGSWRLIPEFLVLDVTGGIEIEPALEQLVKNAPAGETNVIAVGDTDGVEQYRRLRRLGFSEYIVRPLDADGLASVVGDIMRERLSEGLSVDSDRLLCVQGVRGGAGASTLAAAIARAVATRHRKRVCLLDLDLNFGTAHISLGTNDTPGLIDMFQNESRIDALFMERTVERPVEGLMLLSAHREDAIEKIGDDSLRHILIQAQRASDLVVVDLPFRTRLGAELPAHAGMNLFVTPPTVPGFRDTAALLTRLDRLNYGGRNLVVLNRVGAYRDGELGVSEFAKRVGCAVRAVPDDRRGAGRAMITDNTIGATGGKAARALEAIYAELPTAPQGRPGGWRRLLGRT